ncbi:iron complex transport system ATP-binding protein [Gracilibacillus orientalis]|uniref:Iron complex transport system ATP-binding protein n=1 Tax=Gracilibacillus orientalis TaxID=334253 RepID=A0A1I4LWG0_9BACI|nr:ABC transporter ATP-binding protein [Gracilibacillus orientalis]SFL95282.1 iron complex transport system ATP-binding protein [Gracilibacillus orientalis]
MVLDLQKVGLKKEGNWILKEIDWKMKKGEHWTLLGLNGAGKTALLHMLCSYYFPTEGKVKVIGKQFGKDVLGEQLRQQIGIVSSALKQRIYGTDSAYQVILSGAFASIGLYETPTDEMRAKAKQLLKDLDCFSYANRAYRTLSQGEQQRVLIGRALINNPKLLILDEPTSGLDFVAKEQLLESIEQISRSENAPSIIYVTHHVEEILPTFSKTLLLKDGRVFNQGATKTMVNSENLTAFFGVPVEVDWSEKRPRLKKI